MRHVLSVALIGLALTVVPGAREHSHAATGKSPKLKDVAEDINAPRPDMRKAPFDVHEGTWMSVDVSQDGKTLVFDLLGDLYTLPIAGGEAKVLSQGPAFDSNPRFSPDGKTILFTSDRGGMLNLWLVNADGSAPRAVTDEKDAYVYSASWMPDGEYVLARREDGKRAGIPPVELWLIHVQGGSGVPLVTKDDRHNCSGPVASRDGRSIFYSTRPGRFSYTPDLSGGLWQIERYDRATSRIDRITTGFGGAGRPLLSPDGKTLVFVSRRDNGSVLVARNLDTGAERIIAEDVTHDEQEGFTRLDLWPNYAFTPDGRTLVFSNHGKLSRLDLGTRAITPIPFMAHVVQWFRPRVAWQEKMPPGPVQAKLLRWPSESVPDAGGRRWIAFDAFGRVWLQAVQGGKALGSPRRLTADERSLPGREYAPAFSGDGRWIAWVSWSDAGGGHVWKAPVPEPGAEGARVEPVRLTRVPAHFSNPSWSPAGDRLAVIQGTGLEFRGRQPEQDQYFEIRWLSSEGGDPTFVTTVRVADTFRFHPQAFWSADGTRLYFRDPIEAAKPEDFPKNELVSVRLDGTDRRRHLRFPTAGDIVPSPDERWVSWTTRDNVYLAAIPPVTTKEPPEVGRGEGPVPCWRLSAEAGGYVSWSDGGKTITWGLGNVFHRLPVDDAIRWAREKKAKEGAKDGKESKEDEKALDVPQSQQITIALSMPRAAPSGSFVLRGARVITMKGDEVLENADVLVTGNRIAGLAPNGSMRLAAGVRELDAHGTTIIPGLIDTHAHLHYSGFEVFPERKWEYFANLAYGVTTIYDPSAPSLDVFAQGEMVEAGIMTGPRIFSSGDVLYGGERFDVFADVKSLSDAERQVRRMQAYGARMIKVYQQPRRAQRLWFAQACRNRHMLLTAEGAGELYTDLSMATDGFTAFEHALPVELSEDVVRFLAASGTFYTPTLLVAYGGPWGEEWFWQNRNAHDDPKLNRFTPHFEIDSKSRRHPWIWPDEYRFPVVASALGKIVRAGGKVSLGAHGQVQGLGAHWELWAMAGEGGPNGAAMTPMEALRAATLSAADKIGFAPDLGSVEPGKLADLVVLEDDPRADIHNSAKIRWVIKNGEVFEGETMAGVWPERKDPPRFFWKDSERASQ